MGIGVPINLDSCAIKEDGACLPRQPAKSWAPTTNVHTQGVGTHRKRVGPSPVRETRGTFPSPRRHPLCKNIFTTPHR